MFIAIASKWWCWGLPETGECSEHGSGCHTDGEPHHEAHLDPVKTAGLALALAVRSYCHWHLRHYHS